MAISISSSIPIIMTLAFMVFTFLSYPAARKKNIRRFSWSWIFLSLAIWAFLVSVEYDLPQFKSLWLTFVGLAFYALGLHFFFVESVIHYFGQEKKMVFSIMSAILVFGSLVVNFIMGIHYQEIFLITSLVILLGLFVVNILSSVRQKTLDMLFITLGNSIWIFALCSITFEGTVYFIAFTPHDYFYIFQIASGFILFLGERYRLNAIEAEELPEFKG